MTPDQSAMLPEIMLSVFSELVRSYHKHGHWLGKGPDEVFCIIHEELLEAHEAMLAGDRDGPHGYRTELCQVMACCAKAIIEMGASDEDQNNKARVLDASCDGQSQ